MTPIRSIAWLRRDFRLKDQPTLSAAAAAAQAEGGRALCVFVHDPKIVAEFEPGLKPSAYFFGALVELRRALEPSGAEIALVAGPAERAVPALAERLGVRQVFAGRDYEPSGIARDLAVGRSLEASGGRLTLIKDHVLNEMSEVLTGGGDPYRVFTPYKNAALARLKQHAPTPHAAVDLKLLAPMPAECAAEGKRLWQAIEARVEEGRKANPELQSPGESAARARLARYLKSGIQGYAEERNYPARPATSHTSGDLRSGALSPRQVWLSVLDAAAQSKLKPQDRDTFLSELLWRDFFIMLGFHYPHVFEGNYNRVYDTLAWRDSEDDFERWCKGETGYPLVDAGMRELAATGQMHGRARMVCAMFLTKHLLIDWRRGERFFRQHLIDGEHAVNNGNWQWCASTGCDAQPYFRIFNPTTQAEKFDPEGEYIRHWVTELKAVRGKGVFAPTPMERGQYAAPIVEHAVARQRCLDTFAAARGK